MKKIELIQAVAKKIRMDNATVEVMLDSFTEVIYQELAAGREVKISGFGKFIPFQQKLRHVGDPRDRTKTITVNPITVPKFRPGAEFKQRVRGETHEAA